MSATDEILLKKSACHSVAQFPSDPFRPLGILIQGSVPPDSILSGWRNKIRRADFFNRIDDTADIGVMIARRIHKSGPIPGLGDRAMWNFGQ